MISKICYLSIALLLLANIACTSDELPAPETPEFCNNIEAFYNVNVKPIIDGSCAYSGCHDGAGGIGPFNYTSYGSLSSYLDNKMTTFRERVLENRDNPGLGMPPDQSVYPESQKDNLTEEELQIIECWLDAGFPEE